MNFTNLSKRNKQLDKRTVIIYNNIFHSQDLLSRDVLLMFPKLIGIIIICDFCIMGIPWDVP